VTGSPRARRTVALTFVVLAVLVVFVFVSLTVGARPIPPAIVWEALIAPRPDDPDHSVVLTQRVPRTVIGILAGAALAAAGAVMQGVTRNPLADPGLLGVNAGASVAVLIAVTVLGIAVPSAFVWFAFVGAAVAAIVVALIGGRGVDAAGPAKLALTGAAVTAGLTSVSVFILTTDIVALDVYRYWSVGGLTARGLDTVAAVLAPVLVGLVLALIAARGLDLLALGDDTARGLGHSVSRTRALAIVAAILLCGGATAIAGPIVFLGLLIPHLLRAFVGDRYALLIALGIPLGAALLLAADVAGRVIAPPGEVQAGIVVAFLGAPLLISLVLRPKQVTL
jgi:iron complex transport system permease protein